jgi:hypothetical protein
MNPPVDGGAVDASVLALVERLRERRLATLDHRHFAILRPVHVEARAASVIAIAAGG